MFGRRIRYINPIRGTVESKTISSPDTIRRAVEDEKYFYNDYFPDCRVVETLSEPVYIPEPHEITIDGRYSCE